MGIKQSFHPLQSHGAPRILSVDDEPGILDSRELLLQCEGYEVLSAPDGEQALHFAQQHPGPLTLGNNVVDSGANLNRQRTGRDDNNGYSRSAPLHFLCDSAAVHAWHQIVQQDHIHRMLFEKIKGLLAVRRAKHFIAFALKEQFAGV